VLYAYFFVINAQFTVDKTVLRHRLLVSLCDSCKNQQKRSLRLLLLHYLNVKSFFIDVSAAVFQLKF